MRPGREPRVDHEPQRTCLGCRRVRPQRLLLRLRRLPDGRVAPDPARRGGGRGAYLCYDEACLAQALRRDRWTRAFRAPSRLDPDAQAEIRVLVQAAGPRADVVVGATGVPAGAG